MNFSTGTRDCMTLGVGVKQILQTINLSI